MEEKNMIRKRMKEMQRTLSEKDRLAAGNAILEKVAVMPEFLSCRYFFTYLSCRMEVPTHALVEFALKEGKVVAAPKVTGDGKMEFWRIDSLRECLVGAFGILEPKGGRVLTPKEAETFLLLPGLAFTVSGKRLGYGGGYYDRYLEKYSGAFRAAPAYPFAVLDDLPSQAHDRRADAIVLPSEVIYTHVRN